MREAKIGEIVMYAYPRRGAPVGIVDERPAIVVKKHGGLLVNLVVFLDGGNDSEVDPVGHGGVSAHKTSVNQSQEGLAGCYRVIS